MYICVYACKQLYIYVLYLNSFIWLLSYGCMYECVYRGGGEEEEETYPCYIIVKISWLPSMYIGEGQGKQGGVLETERRKEVFYGTKRRKEVYYVAI